jgi:hypothetical protein
MKPNTVSPTRRSWTSLLLAGITLGMVITGLLSYLQSYSSLVTGSHTWFGLGFLCLFTLHLLNNGRSLLNYLRKPAAKWQLLSAGGILLVIFIGIAAYIPPFSNLIDTGYKLRQSGGVEDGSYQLITTRPSATGTPLQFTVRAGKHYRSAPQPLFLGLTYQSTPQMAFWVEDMAGNYIETLYVTGKIASSNFRSSDISDAEVRRRPESLPFWSHKRGIKDTDGLMVPKENNTDLDGVTSATPGGHYDIHTTAQLNKPFFRVLLEINRSYDFNNYYHPQRYPDDPVYSGSGSSGQPSVIYATTISSSTAGQVQLFEAIGHGHHSGENGILYTDMAGIDSAFELLDFALVRVGATL